MENRIAVYASTVCVVYGRYAAGTFTFQYFYISGWICMRCSDIFEENGVPVENV